LCQRAFGDEHHNAPDYAFNAGTYRGFNAGAPAVVYSAKQSRNYQPWLLIRLQCCSIAGRSTEAGGESTQGPPKPRKSQKVVDVIISAIEKDKKDSWLTAMEQEKKAVKAKKAKTGAKCQKTWQ
jgi:hypothetical protein